jgi:hypothetical protein
MFSKKSLKDRYYEAKKKYAENEFASWPIPVSDVALESNYQSQV